MTMDSIELFKRPFYYLRHGETESNAAFLIAGSLDVDLTPLGRKQAQAAAAALGGEYEEFVGVGWTCCYLIYACERVRDYDRAAQWCRSVAEFADRMRIQFLSGICRVHVAAVLTWHGRWTEADDVLSKAIGDLAQVIRAILG